MLWAELGDVKSRWESFRHLQAEAGAVPITKASGKSHIVQFRYSCNKLLRYASYWLSFVSLNRCEWANKYYRDQRAKGHSHHQALRALGAKWLKIIFIMWRDDKPYDENYHLANIARQQMRQTASKTNSGLDKFHRKSFAIILPRPNVKAIFSQLFSRPNLHTKIYHPLLAALLTV